MLWFVGKILRGTLVGHSRWSVQANAFACSMLSHYNVLQGFYEEAVILLNKAIKGEKKEKGLYVNRGG